MRAQGRRSLANLPWLIPLVDRLALTTIGRMRKGREEISTPANLRAYARLTRRTITIDKPAADSAETNDFNGDPDWNRTSDLLLASANPQVHDW